MRLLRPWSFLTVLLLAGCALDGLTSSDPDPETGPGVVYALVRFNGYNVPAQVPQGQTVVEVTKGALTLASDSTWIMSVVLKVSGGGQSQVNIATQRGRYRVTGTTLEMGLQADTTTRLRGTYSTTDVSVQDISVPNGDQLAFRR